MKYAMRFGRGRLCSVAIAAMIAAMPLSAQQADSPQAEKIRQLEQRLDQLTDEAQKLRVEIDQLKKETTPPETAASQETPAAPVDLTAVEPVTTTTEQTPTATSAETAPPADQGTLDTTPVVNASTTAASKVFNPDISVIGNFIGDAGDRNPFDERPTLSLHESEIGLEAFVDPYAKAKFFLSYGPGGADVEEGFINFVNLPADLTAKVGKMKAAFGKVNTQHPHVLPWVDEPLVLHNFFGEEGLNDSGISVSKLFPNSFNLFVEGTGEVYAGNVDNVFETKNRNDLFYLGHLKLYRDLSENSNIELGTSYARGTLPGTGGRNQFGGVDLIWRWKPLQQGLYRSFISRTELIANDRADQTKNGWGFYTSADYQFAQRWFTGLRLDRAAHADAPSLFDKGAALTLTFWPSEFSQLRGELRHVIYPDITTNELLMQVQFAIGAHGAHTF